MMAVLFAAPFLGVSCNTEDVEINANGIQSDSTTILLPYTQGGQNYLTVSSMRAWWVEFEDAGQGSWLTGITPDEGVFTSQVVLSADRNPWRRRSTRIFFNNGIRADSVIVTQRAQESYEPGTVIYFENFGTDTVRTSIPVDSYTSWGARGTGVSVTTYSGTDAYIQSEVMSADYYNQPHEELSSVNSLQLEPGGQLKLPRLNKAEYNNVILTLYLAAWDNGYRPVEANSLYIEGGTDGENYDRLPIGFSNTSGWQKVEVEFAIIESSSNLYLRLGNEGTQPLFIDDILLEAAGTGGSQTIGTPTPSVTTLSATDITPYTAEVGLRYSLPVQINAVVSAGIQWRHSGDVDYTEEEIADAVPDTNETVTLIGLDPGEQYYYRAYTVHGEGIYTYGNELSFTTSAEEEY